MNWKFILGLALTVAGLGMLIASMVLDFFAAETGFACFILGAALTPIGLWIVSESAPEHHSRTSTLTRTAYQVITTALSQTSSSTYSSNVKTSERQITEAKVRIIEEDKLDEV